MVRTAYFAIGYLYAFLHLKRRTNNSSQSAKAVLKTFLKRIQQVPTLLRQALIHGRLTASGVKVSPTSFLSGINTFEGPLHNLSIGEGTFIGRARIQLHSKVSIGNNACVNDGARILTGSHAVDDPNWSTITRPVQIEDGAWIATDAMLLPGVRIGANAIVGAGAVVSKDVPNHGICAGNPARILKNRLNIPFNYSPSCRVALFSAWCIAETR